jgi:hypothetical protein
MGRRHGKNADHVHQRASAQGVSCAFLPRWGKRPKDDQAPSGAVVPDAIASLTPVGWRDDANPPRVRLRLSFRHDHQIAAANTTQTPSGSGTKNAPNVASAAGDLIFRKLFIPPTPLEALSLTKDENLQTTGRRYG